MAFVYFLFSEKLNRYYVGSTNEMLRRLNEHNAGMTPSTKAGQPWRLVFTHETTTLTEARQIENKIKKWKDRRLIERVIKERKLRVG